MGTFLYPGTWVEAVDQSWGAFPARDLLEASSPEWASIRLAPPERAEAATLGLAGRALKYGMSVAVALPMMGGAGLTRIMIYLNRLRADALTGALRTPWLNPSNLDSNPDIILISRPQAVLRELSRIQAQGVRAKVLRSGYSRDRKQTLNLDTLIVNASSGLVEMADLIHIEAKPWVFVIDGTPGGTEHAAQIDAALMQSFPEIPRLVLMSSGDETRLKQLRDAKSGSHLWVMRNADRLALQPGALTVPEITITRLADTHANTSLESIAREFFSLRIAQEKNPDPVLRKRLQLIGKVFRGLNELSVPLHYLERVLVDATRPGLYQVNSLERWLEIATADSTRFGDTEGRSQQLIRQLQAYHKALMEDAIPAKAGWLKNRVKERIAKGIRTLVLCGTVHEAKAIEQWLDDEVGDNWETHVEISAMDGIRAFRRQRDTIQDILITGMLWPSRQHWLAQPSREVLLTAYPFESAQVEKNLGRWWNTHGAASKHDGDKLRFMLLEIDGPPLLDQETVPAATEISVTDGTEVGEYPHKPNPVKIDVPNIDDTWLDLLLAEPPTQAACKDSPASFTPDMVQIHIEEEEQPLIWPANRPVLILDATGFTPIRPQFLNAGAVLILMKNHEDRLATQEQLFDMIAEEEGMQQILRVANIWDRLVDQINEKYSDQKNLLKVELKSDGVDVEPQTIATWLRHRVWGPQNLRAIYTFARLTGHKNPEATCQKVGNAISTVRVIHRRLGADLNKAICSRAAGATQIVIGRLTVDGETFDQMIQKVTVTAVERPTTPAEREKLDVTLLGTVDEVMQRHPGRLLFTIPAQKALRDSNYLDIAKFRACLELMATALYDAYSVGGTLPSALQQFTQAGIEFKPKMSEVTMGRYFDDRKYKNRLADMNRHFCLGTARDTKWTLRIHFEWDKEDQILVIHHAGRHLETSQS